MSTRRLERVQHIRATIRRAIDNVRQKPRLTVEAGISYFEHWTGLKESLLLCVRQTLKGRGACLWRLFDGKIKKSSHIHIIQYCARGRAQTHPLSVSLLGFAIGKRFRTVAAEPGGTNVRHARHLRLTHSLWVGGPFGENPKAF